MHKRCMTNGFRPGLLAAFLGVMASSFGEADLMHHDIPRLPSFAMAFKKGLALASST